MYYVKSNLEYHVTVNVEDQSGQLVASPAYQESIIFKNTYVSPKLGKVTLKKVDSETGKLLANAEFELQDSKGNIVQKKHSYEQRWKG